MFSIHSILPVSRANGPGMRMVIWLQGCTLGCSGCFNPETHAASRNNHMTVEEIFSRILEGSDIIEGITVSGGEPFQQAEPLLALLRRVRTETSLSTLVFSGYTLSQIQAIPHGKHLLQVIDVLIDGPFVERLQQPGSLSGSTNQEIHFLSSRYTTSDIEDVLSTEIQIDNQGNVHITGFPEDLASNLKASLSW